MAEQMLDIGGLRLLVRDEGQGEPLILVHGGPGLSHDYLFPQLGALGAGRRLISYDQRGSGGSEAAPSGSYTWQDHVADLEALRQRLGLGLGKIHLLGFSWGGCLVLLYALQHPEHVASLVVASAMPPRHDGWGEAYRTHNGRLAEERRVKERAEAAATEAGRFAINAEPYFHDAGKARLMTPWRLSPTMGDVSKGTIASLGEYDLRSELPGLAIPTLVIHGRHDGIPVSFAAETAGLIPGASLVVLEESGHCSFVEEPDAFCGAVEAHLKTVTAKEG